MRRSLWIVLTLVACGDDAPTMIDAPIGSDADAPTCLPQSAVGAFYRRMPNPRIVAGSRTFTSGVDTQLHDPDLLWDGAKWHLFYATRVGSFTSASLRGVRHATSTDLITWTFDDPLWLTNAYMPSAVRKPDGSFLIAYADEAAGTISTASFSATGTAMGAPAIALTSAQLYPNASSRFVFDPELALVNGTYHLWFASRDCDNTAPCTHQGIGHATSSDGTTWALDTMLVPSLLRASSDTSTGGYSPSVIYDDLHCRWEMWLTNDAPSENTNPIYASTVGEWHATSTNGTSWTISYSQIRDFLADTAAAGEHLGIRIGGDVAMKSSGRYLLYTGFDDQNVPASSTLPNRNGTTTPGVMTLNLATRDAPP